jgi:hypothetical protein
MKKTIFTLCCTFLLSTFLFAQQKETAVLRHVVLFKFTAKTSLADIQQIEKKFAALPSKINYIKSFEWGLNASPEKLNEGLTHCYFISFASEKERDDYIIDPNHKQFIDFAKPFIEKVVVVDYWVK